MVDGIKCYANVYFKDGYVEEIDNQKFASISDSSCHFVEFETSRGMYGYVSGWEVVPSENNQLDIRYRSWANYLKYDKETRKWSPTDEIEKVLVTRMEDGRGLVVRSGFDNNCV